MNTTANPRRGGRHPTATITNAIEVFMHGFAFCRSFTYPYLVERMADLWLLRDAPRKNPREYRTDEWVAFGVSPDEVDRLARQHIRGRFAISALHSVSESDESLRADYRRLKYRLRTTEPLFVHELKRIPKFEPPTDVKIVRVMKEDLAKKLAKAAGRAQIKPEHFVDSAPIRQYVALDGHDHPIGWVRSIHVPISNGSVGTWCSNMHIERAHRRKGIGKALLSRMLRDDREHGAHFASLLASHAGALLYPHVGYRQIGKLLLYSPPKRSMIISFRIER